ncbi:hypothetical protein BDP27DRAFT_1365393 [Rhodocollybia butyracea]|uniref:Uncharacterized protein n=1 Tax=Rhodocollybia butyracea TaxID=206335 RepID=A0A9P5U5I2_9AGAR|nr:hypothetical protein BDP27DRAFT_1365393 [Rhodocollybia butyracea]
MAQCKRTLVYTMESLSNAATRSSRNRGDFQFRPETANTIELTLPTTSYMDVVQWDEVDTERLMSTEKTDTSRTPLLSSGQRPAYLEGTSPGPELVRYRSTEGIPTPRPWTLPRNRRGLLRMLDTPDVPHAYSIRTFRMQTWMETKTRLSKKHKYIPTFHLPCSLIFVQPSGSAGGESHTKA